MAREKRLALLTGITSLVGLICWLTMFLAGQDVWHDVGRPDFWKLQGPPHSDLRVFALAFYAQLLVLAGGLIASAAFALRRPR